MEQTRILSIQSHVVSGHCGNTAAVFPLQLLGFEVDVINSVQFSNHTQYKISRGNIFNKKDFDLLYEGLTTNNLTDYYTNILSGYIADLTFIESLVKAVEEIKKKRRSLGLPCTYTFDPVLGDDGPGFYVPNPEGVADAYKKLMTQADIILPNRFEASYLSGIDVKDIPTALSAIDVFHSFGVEVVVITSVQLDSSLDVLTCLASYKKKNGQTDGKISSIQRYRIDVPRLDKPFTGTGDLFAALFTAWIQKTGSNIKLSLEKSISTIAKILKDTHEWSNKNQSKFGVPMAYELRIVQNKCTIEEAIVEYIAEPI